MQDKQHDDRRQFGRLPATLQVDCVSLTHTGEVPAHAVSNNISIGGIGIVLQENVRVGTHVVLHISIPDSNRKVCVEGTVAWVQPFQIGQDHSFDTGISFTNLSDETAQDIAGLVR